MSVARAALVAAAAATAVYLSALGNSFTLDDGPVVERNAAAHSVGRALRAFDEPYWPPEHGAGQYRPVAILSFAVDWSASGGSTLWLHGANVLWHALASALVVTYLSAYLLPAGALAGGLIFAVHPVHVEAVANLVGRAELLAAVGLLTALLLARRVRSRRGAGEETWQLEIGVLLAVLFALLAKEHAAVAVGLLAVDDLAARYPADPAGPPHPFASARAALPARLYAGVALLTVAWFIARNAIEGGLSFQAVAPTFFGLDALGRVSTMLPVVFVVARLMVFPFDLSADYHPQVVPRLTHPTLLGAAGLILVVALLWLGWLLHHRNRAASVGVAIVALGWLPTANVFFPTGVVLAERALYLPTVGLALVAGALWLSLVRRRGARVAAVALAVVFVALAAKTALHSRVWRSNRSLVLYGLERHPESYRVHQAVARVYMRQGETARALREYGLAAELYPEEHLLLTELAGAALVGRQPRLALRYLELSKRRDSAQSLTHQLVAHALLELDSARAALSHARRAVELAPLRVEALKVLGSAYLALGAAERAALLWPAFRARGGSAYSGWLLEASTRATLGQRILAALALDSAERHAAGDSVSRRELREVAAMIARPVPASRNGAGAERGRRGATGRRRGSPPWLPGQG